MESFLYDLRLELEKELTAEQTDYQMNLYRNYFVEEMKKGKTEEQVLRKLGDSAKVAEMIMDSYREREEAEDRQSSGMSEADEINSRIRNPEHGIKAEFKENEGWDIRLGKLKLNSWYGTLIILGVVLVICIFISMLFPGLGSD